MVLHQLLTYAIHSTLSFTVAGFNVTTSILRRHWSIGRVAWHERGMGPNRMLHQLKPGMSKWVFKKPRLKP